MSNGSDNGGFGNEHDIADWMLPMGYGAVTKCECGVDKVYGKAALESYHSDWCPIGRAREVRLKLEKEKESKNNAKNS